MTIQLISLLCLMGFIGLVGLEMSCNMGLVVKDACRAIALAYHYPPIDLAEGCTWMADNAFNPILETAQRSIQRLVPVQTGILNFLLLSLAGLTVWGIFLLSFGMLLTACI